MGVAIGSIESEDEESEKTKTTQDVSTQQRNLALPQPSYASIASHEVSNIAQEPELPSREEVIALKSGKTLPIVVNVEEKMVSGTDLKDPEGFEEVTTRKVNKKLLNSFRTKNNIKILKIESNLT